jgi:hypothetical protein
MVFLTSICRVPLDLLGVDRVGNPLLFVTKRHRSRIDRGEEERRGMCEAHKPVGAEEEELRPAVAIAFVGEKLHTGSDVR